MQEQGERDERRVEQLRRIWLVVVAAVVLLPPFFWGLLAVAASVMYLGMRLTRIRRGVRQEGMW